MKEVSSVFYIGKIMLFLIGQALADEKTQQSGGWISFLPMVALMGIIYFLLIRPQQKRTKQHQLLLASIKKGDKVTTSSGMLGTVSKIVEQEVVLEIADGVHCKFVKSAIVSVVKAEANASEKTEKDVKCKCIAAAEKSEDAQSEDKTAANEKVKKVAAKADTNKPKTSRKNEAK
jgi:preprotein translocase subunit YajC